MTKLSKKRKRSENKEVVEEAETPLPSVRVEEPAPKKVNTIISFMKLYYFEYLLIIL